MRKAAVVIGWVLLGAGIFFWSRQGGAPRSGEDAPGSQERRGAAVQARALPNIPDAVEWTRAEPSPEQLATPGGTPALQNPATDKDGHFEIRVVAADKPRSGAQVRLYLRGPRDPASGHVPWRLAGGGTTGTDGTLRLAARPGAYLAAVRAEGFAAARREIVRSTGEALTRVTIPLEAGSTLLGKTVEKRTGQPVSLVELVLTSQGREAFSGWRSDAPAEERIYATSDPRGQFRIDGLAPGSYRLEAQAPGHARKVRRSVRVPSSAEVVVEMIAAGVIEGTVFASDGKPAQGAEVVVVGDEEPSVAVTGPEGAFTAEVSPGTYGLSAKWKEESGRVDEPVAVASGATRKGIVLRLGKGSAIAGVVKAKRTGAPVANAVVGLSPFNETGELGRAFSGSDGRFAVEGLAPGSYDVIVSAEGFSELARRGVTVAQGQRFELELELQGTGAVEGVVKDGEGKPIAGAIVRGGNRWGGFFVGAASADARTDADGHYQASGLELGRARLTAARGEGMAGVSQFVQIEEGQVARADFTLEASGFLKGKVTRKAGGPPDKPTVVRAFPMAGMVTIRDLPAGEVGADGSYQMELPPARYRVAPMRADEGRMSWGSAVAAVIESGKTAELDLVLADEAESVVSGRVLEPGGEPSAGGFVTVSLDDASAPAMPMFTVSADEEGRFEIPQNDRFGARALSLRAHNGGRMGTLRGVQQGSRDVAVQLQPGATVDGTVTGDRGTSTSFQVSVIPKTGLPVGFIGNAREMQGDRFVLNDVPAMDVRIGVTTRDGREGHADVSLSPGARQAVTIALEAGATVTGRVVEAATNKPLSMAMVILDQNEETTGDDGLFQLANVGVGEHKLQAFSMGHKRLERTFEVKAGQKLDLGDLTLEPLK